MTPIIIEDEAFEENILEEEKTTEKQIKEENIQTTIKLDYSLETPEERNELVKKIINNTPSEQLTPRYLEILSDYIIFAMDKQERKQKQILTDNHMVTVNKRETSFEGLVGRLENGEDGIYNMIANDKNIIFTPKFQITQQDIAEIPELKQLVDAIAEVEKAEKKAVGKKKFLLKKQLIAMRQDQYVIRSAYKPPIYCMNAIKSFSKIDFDENVSISGDDEIEDNSLVSFFNPKHVSALLCNYSRLKEDAWGKFYSDSYFLMEDLDTLIEKTLRDSYPMYYDLLIYKIDGKQNLEIQSLLNQKHNVKHSVEYISSLWRNKIPKLLSEQAQEDYLIWYYTTQKKGKWKKCSRCGEIKLAHNKFFSKNKTSKDHFYSICKCCRNKKNK
jgi:hypothetical protein